jgi:hypothetical protein
MIVETAIESGNVLKVRRQLIADFGMFYIGMCPNPQQGDYKRIAIVICEKFPELKDSIASRFWVRFIFYRLVSEQMYNYSSCITYKFRLD